jgi:hypothetical protein
MPQAAAIPTTRRAFSKWLAAVGVIAAMPAITPASAAVPEVGLELIEAAARIKQALAVWSAADDEVTKCKAIVERWKTANPQPDSSDLKYEAEDDFWKAYNRDYNEWHVRHMAALRDSGVGRAKAAELNAAEDLDSARYAFLDITPASMTELLFMARMARDCDTANGAIAWVVVDNLVEMHSPAKAA